MRTLLSLALATICATQLFATNPAQAQFGLFLRNRGDLQFTDEDWQLFRDAVIKTLEEPNAGNRTEWQNPKTNMHGDVFVENTLQIEGAPCARLRARIVRTEENIRRLTFCRDAGGRWAIAPD